MGVCVQFWPGRPGQLICYPSAYRTIVLFLIDHCQVEFKHRPILNASGGQMRATPNENQGEAFSLSSSSRLSFAQEASAHLSTA
jgi:hypothetical protein